MPRGPNALALHCLSQDPGAQNNGQRLLRVASGLVGTALERAEDTNSFLAVFDATGPVAYASDCSCDMGEVLVQTELQSQIGSSQGLSSRFNHGKHVLFTFEKPSLSCMTTTPTTTLYKTTWIGTRKILRFHVFAATCTAF
jgi:hypothetical protein